MAVCKPGRELTPQTDSAGLAWGFQPPDCEKIKLCRLSHPSVALGYGSLGRLTPDACCVPGLEGSARVMHFYFYLFDFIFLGQEGVL